MTTPKPQPASQNAFVASWADLLNGDDGAPIAITPYTDKSAQVFGTFGAGGSLPIEGSNDGVNWAVLTDPQGNDLRFTTGKIEFISEATRFLRPGPVSGDGTTSLTVLIFLKE